MIDLNTLLQPNSGWVLVDAYGVNDNGQITGYELQARNRLLDED